MKNFLLIFFSFLFFTTSAQVENNDQLISHYTLQINTHPDSISNYVKRSIAYNDKGDFIAAIADCNVVLKTDPKNIDALRIRGYAFYNQKKYDSSISDLSKVIIQNPTIAKVWNVRGLDYYWLNRLDSAVNDYSQALRIDPKYGMAWHNRGDAYYWSAKYELAIGDLSESLLYEPKNVKTFYIRGLCYFYTNKFNTAIEDFTKGLSITPDDVDLLANRGVNYYCIEKYDSSLKDLTDAIRLDAKNTFAWIYRGNTYKALRKYDLAITDYTQALFVDPQNADALFKRGTAYYFSDKNQDAINDFSHVLNIVPLNADAFVYRGNTYTEILNFDAALEDYKHALQINPKYIFALVNQGMCYKKMSKPAMAMMSYNAALQLQPNNLEALLDRGNLYSDLFKPDSALQDYNTILNIDPTFTEARNNRGNIFFYQGKFDLAISDYNLILLNNPHSSNALFNRANSYKFLGKYDLAMADISQLLAVEPTSVKGLNVQGNIYLSKNQLDSALWSFNKALRIEPDDTFSLSDRGLVYSNQKKYDLALNDFDKALKLNPKFVGALNNRALIFYKQNKHDLAIADFKKALEVRPDYALIMINLILVYLSHNEYNKAADLYNQYRQKKFVSFVDVFKSYSFLKNYITACCDHLLNKDYEKALQLLETSLQEYKDVNQDSHDIPVSWEYANVLAKAGYVCQQLSQKEKSLEYYRIAYMINPMLPGVSAKIENISSAIKAEVAASNIPAEIKLSSPNILHGTVLEKPVGGKSTITITGNIIDKAGTASVSVNDINATNVREDGYFSVQINNDVSDLTIKTKNKTGRTSTFTYHLQATQNSRSDNDNADNIPAIKPTEKPRFHAILIACSDYTGDLKKLPNTIIEARQYKNVLTKQYGFAEKDIDTLYNKDYKEILSAIYSKLKSLTENDNLVLFFAGHGTYKQTTSEVIGYWIPLNATIPELDYISNQKLDEIVAGCAAKHILLVSDACYSAAMRSDGNEKDDDKDAPPLSADKQLKLKSRQILTSGGMEKVPEKSVFIEMVIKTLEQDNSNSLTAKDLYADIYQGVKIQTGKKPELNLFGRDGNEGGQFYFIRSK